MHASASPFQCDLLSLEPLPLRRLTRTGAKAGTLGAGATLPKARCGGEIGSILVGFSILGVLTYINASCFLTNVNEVKANDWW